MATFVTEFRFRRLKCEVTFGYPAILLDTVLNYITAVGSLRDNDIDRSVLTEVIDHTTYCQGGRRMSDSFM